MPLGQRQCRRAILTGGLLLQNRHDDVRLQEVSINLAKIELWTTYARPERVHRYRCPSRKRP